MTRLPLPNPSREKPGAYGQLGLADLFELREECLREFGFQDVYRRAGLQLAGLPRLLGNLVDTMVQHSSAFLTPTPPTHPPIPPYPCRKDKERENGAALEVLPDLLTELDAMAPPQRLLALVQVWGCVWGWGEGCGLRGLVGGWSKGVWWLR